MLIQTSFHVSQSVLYLEVALLEEFGLEVGQDRETSLEKEYFSVEDHIVPNATSDLEINIFDKNSYEPVS